MRITIDFALLRRNIALGAALASMLIVANSCDQQGNQQFVINEIVASNHSGIQAKDGELYDWLEIKNISNETASLSNYTLVLEKSANQGEDVKQKTWDLPAIDVKAGECIVIFASKKDKTDPNGELHASFKLPSNGGKLQLMNGSSVVSEVTFDTLEDDQCYRRLDDGTYEVSYETTPGYENNKDNYEKYCSVIDKQRTGSLRVWELLSKPIIKGESWVEIKNVSDATVDLQNYYLTTSKKEMSQWQFPAIQLQPGQVYLVISKDAGFKIGKDKAVSITCNGKFVDGLCAGGSSKGVSVGRIDGKSDIFYFKSPTPGANNTITSSSTRYIADDEDDE